MEVVASLSQDRTAAAQCGLFTHKSVPVIFEPPCSFKKMLKSLTHLKFLGINISNNLKWNTHIQFLRSKINKVSYMISSLTGDLDLFMLRNIYFTKFQYLIRYGIILWGGERESVKVLKIRKRFFAQLKGLH